MYIRDTGGNMLGQILPVKHFISQDRGGDKFKFWHRFCNLSIKIFYELIK